MKHLNVLILSFILSTALNAQEDSTVFIRQEKIRSVAKDSLKNKSLFVTPLPPRTLIIKSKDLPFIKSELAKFFLIVDDTTEYTPDELSSGLSKNELDNYRKNKKKLKEVFVPPPSEESTYPTVAMLRKILGIAKTIGVIIIFILSL